MSRSEFFSLRNLQGCCLLFNYQGSLFCCLIRDSHINISYVFSLVNNFFKFIFRRSFIANHRSTDSLFRLPYLSTNVNKYFNLFCLRFFSSNLSDVSRVSFVRITHRIRNCQYYFYFLFYLYNSHNLFEIFSTFLTTITLY